jgi:hypothetical protein
MPCASGASRSLSAWSSLPRDCSPGPRILLRLDQSIMKGGRVCVMAFSFFKINQRALIMFYFEAFVNVLFLDAGIASMFMFDILEPVSP